LCCGQLGLGRGDIAASSANARDLGFSCGDGLAGHLEPEGRVELGDRFGAHGEDVERIALSVGGGLKTGGGDRHASQQQELQ
jgi:hypothetical protein